MVAMARHFTRDALVQQREYDPTDSQKYHDYYPISDLHHRTVALLSELGCVVEAYDTDAYGRTLVYGDLAATCRKRLPLCEFIYTGRRYDAESAVYDDTNWLIVEQPGLYYYRARYFSPALGRFIQRDPKGYVDGMGLYEYFAGGPTGAVDPEGMEFARRGDEVFWQKVKTQRHGRRRENNGVATVSRIILDEQKLGVVDADGIVHITQGRPGRTAPLDVVQAAASTNVWSDVIDALAEHSNPMPKPDYDYLAIAWGAYKGMWQGSANAVNGLQDAVVGLYNLQTYVNPGSWMVRAFGYDPTIESRDWSRGLFVNESDRAHFWSKMLGGEALFTLATLGAGQAVKAPGAVRLFNRADDVMRVGTQRLGAAGAAGMELGRDTALAATWASLRGGQLAGRAGYLGGRIAYEAIRRRAFRTYQFGYRYLPEIWAGEEFIRGVGETLYLPGAPAFNPVSPFYNLGVAISSSYLTYEHLQKAGDRE